MAQKRIFMVMKRLLPALLAVVSLSFVHGLGADREGVVVHVGLGADREGVGFKITLGSGKHPVSSEFYSYKQDGAWRYEVTWGNGGHPVSRGKYRYDPFPDDRRFDPLPGPVNDPISLRRRP